MCSLSKVHHSTDSNSTRIPINRDVMNELVNANAKPPTFSSEEIQRAIIAEVSLDYLASYSCRET